MRKVPVVAGLAVLGLGLMLATLGAPPFSYDAEEICDGFAGEGSSYSTSVAAWPPGAQSCTVTTRDGRTIESSFVPWSAWLSVALTALGVYTAATVLRKDAPKRVMRAFAAIGLVLCGVAVWFA